MKPPFVIGLTGSIGMGKTTTAGILRDLGIPVWDADAAVHRLYGTGGGAVELIRGMRPSAVKDGTVDRSELKSWIASDRGALRLLEDVVHPLVASERATFVANANEPIIAVDVPLLFETGSEASVDAVAVVSTDAATQRNRVLSRPGITEEMFETVLAKQMPDAEKRRRADFVIRSECLETAQSDVEDMLNKIKQGLGSAGDRP